jgi:hypothetical protein
MNKVICVFAFFSLFTAACKKKCHECHYDLNDAEIEIGEYCGDDLEALEADGLAVGDTTYEVHCHEH